MWCRPAPQTGFPLAGHAPGQFVRDTPTLVHTDVLGRPFLEQRTKTSAKDENGAYTDVHVALDLQGRASAVSARYVPAGGTEPVSQPATTDVFDLLGRSVRHVRRDARPRTP